MTEYQWFQPGNLGSASSGCALGVRKVFGVLSETDRVVGSPATSEGGGIRERSILVGRIRTAKTLGRLAFNGAASHAPPSRAPRSRAQYMRALRRVRAQWKAGDLNMGQRMAQRLLGRSVVGQGVLWLTVPATWRVLSARAINVGGDHKAILVHVRQRTTGIEMTMLVINAMSVSADAQRSAAIFRRGLGLRADVVFGSECADFRAERVDAARSTQH